MTTSPAQIDPNAEQDILDGMFETEEGQSTDGKGDEANLKGYLNISEKFKDLDPAEGLARTVQSREGVLIGNIKKITDQNATLLKDSQFLAELTTNPELRQAFIAKTNPELIQDVDSQVQNVLRKEFPDFEPVDEEKSDIQSKTSKYFRRQNRLYDTLENSSSNKSVEEIWTSIETRQKDKSKDFNVMIAKIKEDNKYDDVTMQNFMDFAGKFNIFAVHKVYKFKLATSTTGKVASKASSSGIVSQDANLKKIDDMFPKKKSGPSIRKKE